MIGYLFLGILLLAAVLFAMRWAAQADPAFLARLLRYAGLGVIALALLFLLITGRVGVVGALVGLGIPLFLMFRSRNAARGGGGPAGSGGRSSLETAWLKVSLDHASGAIDGEVKQGRFAGRPLASLSADELIALLAECRNADAESATVLEAYLDRTHGPGWRQRGTGAGADQGAGARDGGMSRDEAYAVLGLKPGAGTDDIREAYHRLMKKLHPDQGGSDYLAARLNEARDLLLGS
jgi:DnaJ domain